MQKFQTIDFRWIAAIALIFIISNACVPPSEKEYTEINVNYSDPEIRQVIDLQTEQDLDSLLLLSSSPNPTIRLFVAKAFGSFIHKDALDTLEKLLNDPFIEVRAEAAFAIGQNRDKKSQDALLSAFTQQDSIDVNNIYNANILEAVGKLGEEELLQALATISTYRASDTLLLKGQMRGLYNFGLRKLTHPEATKTVVNYLLEEYPHSVKLLATNYLHRVEDIDLSEYKFQLLQYLQDHPDPNIRMGIATALTRTGDAELLTPLLVFYNQETDYRVKCNILRQIDHFSYINVIEHVLRELSHENPHVSQCAADYIITNGNGYDAPIYRNFIPSIQDDLTAIKLHQAILKNSGRNSGSRRYSTQALQEMYASNSLSPYLKGQILTALSEDGRNLEFVHKNGFGSSETILQTKAVEGIVKMVEGENFYRFLGNSGRGVKTQIAKYIQEAIESGNPGMISAASSVLNNEEINLMAEYQDSSFLEASLARLKLPEDLEAYGLLKNTIRQIKGLGEEIDSGTNNVKEIDWVKFDEYSSTPKAKIITSKGEIGIELYKNQSPLSVMNFIELSKSGFYNNKVFHRVVPNFVIQTGCPNGDGYGSLNYTIRSELNNAYYENEGYIGYASAGKHTESSQWFITHTLTPHLNGNYTIFGKVNYGMDVVHNIQLGDKINRISITN